MQDADRGPDGVGLVHDYLLVLRGAERCFVAMAELAPGAPIYTSLYDEDGMQGIFADREVVTSPLQRLGVTQDNFRSLLPIFPWALRRLPTDRHELVLSSSSAFAHGVRTHPDGVHVCYCHTPFRYAWHERRRALAEVPAVARPALRMTLDAIRRSDCRSAKGVTRFVANGRMTQRRIQECWGHDAPIVHPPVDTNRFYVGTPEDWGLIVTELVPHKRVALTLEAARRARVPMRVVGEGPEAEELRDEFPEVSFLGRVDDVQLADLYSRARFVVVPGPEEFGITAVEAHAAGRPVMGEAGTGVSETVTPGLTGELVDRWEVNEVARTLATTDWEAFRPRDMLANASRFTVTAFTRKLGAAVAEVSGVDFAPQPRFERVGEPMLQPERVTAGFGVIPRGEPAVS